MSRKTISIEKASVIIKLVHYQGFEKAAKKLGMKENSLRRRLREIKFFHGMVPSSVLVTLQKLPKVLLFDIETTPMQVFVWGLFGNKFINHSNVIKDWNVLSWAGKWLFEEEVLGDVLTPKEAKKGDDERIIRSIWKKIDEADIIIAHNGNRFDIKKLNARFLLHGLPPPNPYKSIDTLEVARKYFSFSSNRLDYLGKLMANKKKIETSFGLWLGCMNGKKKSLKKMMTYNIQDIHLLEDVYLELRPWIKSHPNMALYCHSDFKSGKFGCSNCGEEHDPNKIRWTGNYTTTVSQFKTFRCSCGAIVRTRKSHKIAPLMGAAY